MNKEHRKRITQNLTYLKERMLDLDPLVDYLIERDVFQLEHRARIEAATPPTPQRKFNEFVQMLLSSAHPAAYHAFLEALQNERQFYVVERLQNTVVKLENGPMRAKTPHRRPTTAQVVNNYSEDQQTVSKSFTNIEQVTFVMSKVLADFGGKLTEDLVTTFDKRREDDLKEMENKMEAKLDQFGRQWEEEKQLIISKNENAIKALQQGFEKLQRKSSECERLKEKYDQLKQHQKDLRERENERWQKLTQSNLQNAQLVTENKRLKDEVEKLKDKVDELQEEISFVRKKKLSSEVETEHLLTENKNLRIELEEREKERDELRRDIENAYERIHEIIRIQKEKSDAEDTTYKSVLDKQNKKLSEIYDAVNALSARDRLNQIKSSAGPKTLYIGGNTIQRSHRSNKS